MQNLLGELERGSYALGVPGLESWSRGGVYALEDQGLTGSTGWTQETAGFWAQGDKHTNWGREAVVTGVFW